MVISASNPELKLKPRLTANISIYIVDRQDVLRIPSKALRFTPEYPLVSKDAVIVDCEAEHNVWTVSGNTFTAHPVETGITNGVLTEITGGLEEGDTVVSEAKIAQVTAKARKGSSERSPFMPGPPDSGNGEDEEKSE